MTTLESDGGGVEGGRAHSTPFRDYPYLAGIFPTLISIAE
jgi:hypothetical protein